jgi:HK97 family phage major capsid protein
MAARVVGLIDRCLSFAWTHRLEGAAIACALLVMLCAPHGAAAGVICVAGRTVAQLETDLREKQAKAKTLLETTMRAAADTVVTPAANGQPEVKGRLMTAEERAAIDTLLADAKATKTQLDAMQSEANLQTEIDRLTAGMAAAQPTTHSDVRRIATRTMGQQFVSDARVQEFLRAGGHRSRQFTSPAVDVPMSATTLDTTAGSGGPLITPDYLPGILPLLFRRLVVADLIAPGTTDSNLISFMKEKTFTNAAAAVAQGIAKPESTLVFEAATAAVKKIAHWIPVTTEMLDDFAQTTSIIDARLRLGIDLAEEDELLNGTGIGEHQLGLNALTGLSAAVARGADSNIDALMKQITAIATSTFVSPDGVIMNPANWMTIQLTKNAAGNYLGSGPWSAPQAAVIWGLPVAVTPAEVANSALVGAFRTAAQFFRKGGVRVEASNSHADFFITNKVAILGEERGALVVYREAAFGKVTGLN